MAIADKNSAPTTFLNLGTLTTTGANETLRAISPSANNIALLKGLKISDRIGPATAYRPYGVILIVTTTITVTSPVLTLRRNGVNITGATISVGLITAGVNQLYYPFPDYSANIGTDNPADTWSLFVTTTSTAGVVNPVYLLCAEATVPGINAGVSY